MSTPSMRRDDSGFTLVEVVVAAVVLALMGAAVAGVLVQALNLTRGNAQRVQAASVARAQLEAVRSQDPTAIPDGLVSIGTTTVQGTIYTVSQSSSYLQDASTVSPCVTTGSGQDLAYKRVTVSVSWPGAGSTRPLRADTLMALSADQRVVEGTTGTVALAVDVFDGTSTAPLAGAVVTVGTASQTTGEDGCAVFRGLAPGSYASSVSSPGLVDVDGRPSTPGSVVVTAGQLARPAALLLGRISRLDVTFTTMTSGYPALPAVSDMPVTLDTSRFSSTTYRAFDTCTSAAAPTGCVRGYPRAATSLFPAVYKISAGSCTTAAGAAVPSVEAAPGTTTSVTVPLAPLLVRLNSTSAVPANASTTVTATSKARTGCTGQVVNIPEVTRAGAKVSLPAGEWTFARTRFDGQGTLTGTATLGVASVTEVTL